MSNSLQSIPQALKNWFVAHFVIDLLFAIPLMVAPVFTLELFGWKPVDPIATRLVAAALFGIGIESYLGRNAGREAFQRFINQKVIWSSAAMLGISWSLIQGIEGSGYLPWLILVIFLGFNINWVYWRWQLRA